MRFDSSLSTKIKIEIMILTEVTKYEGSSFYGTTIDTTPQSLVDLADKYGIPYNGYNDGSDKTNFDFHFQVGDLQFSVYDWKEYSVLYMEREYRFHIGGKDEESTREGKNILKKLL
jgi:hypothetical protein